jgi:hypothetical protein
MTHGTQSATTAADVTGATTHIDRGALLPRRGLRPVAPVRHAPGQSRVTRARHHVLRG